MELIRICEHKKPNIKEIPGWFVDRLIQMYAVSKTDDRSARFVYVGKYDKDGKPKFPKYQAGQIYVFTVLEEPLMAVGWLEQDTLEFFCPFAKKPNFSGIEKDLSASFHKPRNTHIYNVNGQCFTESNIWSFYFVTQRVKNPMAILSLVFSDCEPDVEDKAVKVFCSATRVWAKSVGIKMKIGQSGQSGPGEKDVPVGQAAQAAQVTQVTQKEVEKMPVVPVDAVALNKEETAGWGEEYLKQNSSWYRFAEIPGSVSGSFFIKG